MSPNRYSPYKLTAILAFTVLFITNSWAATEKKLHNFGNGTDGTNPGGTLVMDAVGNLYGTAYSGGEYGGGIAFELVRNGDGSWTEKKLHNFGGGADGLNPGGGLIMDLAGNLYGVTMSGGDDWSDCGQGCGTVFELSPNGQGTWTEKKLHNFGWNSDGMFPQGELIMDGAGNLYGTAALGGSPSGSCFSGCGVVYELSPNGSGGWSEKKLHEFRNSPDGAVPQAALVFDADGNLYGTTVSGGDYADSVDNWLGTAFEVMHMEDGNWTEKKLHNFGRVHDGFFPSGPLTFDGSGNLYGTTYGGGRYGLGVAFQLSPNGSGGWVERRLHDFRSDGMDGNSVSGLAIDAAGNLYGAAGGGGRYNGGTVFELIPNQDGGWTERTLHNFNPNLLDGMFPAWNLIFDAAGNLYGVTWEGGDYGYGTVFEITP